MKNLFKNPLLLVLGAVLMLPASLLAQPDEKEKKEKDKKEVIVITRTGDEKEKIVVEVIGDKVTVNGKPLDEYKGDNVTVRRGRNADVFGFGDLQHSWGFGGNNNNAYSLLTTDSNRAMLGVTTEKSAGGVEIQEVTRESAASKSGLKKGDVITKIDDTKIETPDDLSKAIKAHKPGDNVTVTYLRDSKEQKASAELGKWKGGIYSFSPDIDFEHMLPKINQAVPRVRTMPYGQNWSWAGGSPKLGLSVQDTEDGKGVKVLEVDEESNAEKAGVKENDIITEVNGKAVNSADEVARIIKESKDKISIMLKLNRSGKVQNIEVKMPRKLKTADL